MDLASININKLYGQSKTDTHVFFSDDYSQTTNKGNLLTLNYLVTAGTSIILQNKSTSQCQLIKPGRVNKSKVYSLNSLAEFLNLQNDWYNFYDFYEYKLEISDSNLYSEVIDWSNPQTTIFQQKATTYINSLGDTPVTSFDPEKISISDNNGKYASVTTINLVSEEMSFVTDGDPFPAKAGIGNYTNDGISERGNFFYAPGFIKKRSKYNFTYRGGTNTLNYHTVKADPIGITTTGVLLYSPAAESRILPDIYNQPGVDTKTGTSTPHEEFLWNRVSFPGRYQRDTAGGYLNEQGVYSYVDGLFLNTAWQDYKVWSKNSYYNNSSYLGDHFRHPNGHSKIIGFCFDGYPIYGPYGYSDPYSTTSSVIQLSSSYITYSPETYVIGRLPLFTYEEWPIGSFINDYKFDQTLPATIPGHLDMYNGRFSITPEFPEGTYAYFLTFSDTSLLIPQYPYIVGQYTKQYRNIYSNNKIKLPVSIEEWEGSNGILETMFSYELYKGLNLLK
jgi:hypothetical protein